MKSPGILEKAQPAMQTAGFDALLALGSDNCQYLSGARLPFAAYRRDQSLAFFWTVGQEPALVCPAEWASVARETAWTARWELYDARAGERAALLAAVQNLVAGLPAGARVGIDLNQVSVGVFDDLQRLLPAPAWIDASTWLTGLRAVKTDAEIELLEEVAALTDHGLNGAIHHVTVDRRTTALTLAEELRVHTEERGVHLVGYHAASHVTAGDENRFFWSNPPLYGYSRTTDLHPEEMVRMKIQTSLDGYWADATRIMTLGEPTPAQADAYAQLVWLRETILAAIQPGVRCREVYAAVRAAAEQAGINLLADVELGHSIGVQPCEPPYLGPCDDTLITAGMVFVLDPILLDGNGLIWRSKDTLLVTAAGNRLLGWYKDWREPYIPIASI